MDNLYSIFKSKWIDKVKPEDMRRICDIKKYLKRHIHENPFWWYTYVGNIANNMLVKLICGSIFKVMWRDWLQGRCKDVVSDLFKVRSNSDEDTRGKISDWNGVILCVKVMWMKMLVSLDKVSFSEQSKNLRSTWIYVEVHFHFSTVNISCRCIHVWIERL